MSEIKKLARPFKVEYVCDKCGAGLMRPTGYAFSTNPPKYEHSCNHTLCDNKMNFFKTYPALEFEIVEDLCGND